MSSVPGKAPAVKLPPHVETGRELLLEQLGRLLTVEETLAKMVLPKLLLEVEDQDLKQVVQQHLGETRGHVGNVKEAFLALGAVPTGKPAYGLDGLRTEHEASAWAAYGVAGVIIVAMPAVPVFFLRQLRAVLA